MKTIEKNPNYVGTPMYDWCDKAEDYIQIGEYEFKKFDSHDELIAAYAEEKAQTMTENFLDHNPEASEDAIKAEQEKNIKYYTETAPVVTVHVNHAMFHNVPELATQFYIKDFGYCLIEA